MVPLAYVRNERSILVSKIEEHAVVATTESKTSERRLELLYVSSAAGQVTIHALENLHGSFAVNGAQISSGLRCPANRDPLGRGRFGHLSFTEAKLTLNLFVGDSSSANE